MRRCPILDVLTAIALLPAAGAHAAAGKFFAAAAVDGPSADIQSLGDVDIARDGTGALAYVRRDGGVDHLFVSRLVDGAWQPPERIDAALAGAGAQPVVAVADGGRLAVAFISGGSLFTVARPAGAAGFTQPVLVAAAASNPALDMSINGAAYLTFTTPGASAADVRAARLERAATEFALLEAPIDIDAARDAGAGPSRSRVAVSADGTALVVWGEGGRLYGRRLFEARLSQAPQEITVDQLDGHAAGAGSEVDVAIEDDSSFAWVVFRQAFEDGAGSTKTRVLARRLVGSQFEAAVAVDGLGFPIPEPAEAPRIALSGRGDGYAASAATGGGTFAAVLKDDLFNAGLVLGSGPAGAARPQPAVDQAGDGLVAWQNLDATIHARPYDNVPATRAVPTPGPEVTLSDPALGPTDAARGFDAVANRAGDVAVVFVQGTAEGRQIVAAAFDRAPGGFRTYTTVRWRNHARTPLRWGAAFDLWGPLTYRVEVDGRPAGETGDIRLALAAVPDGEHRWRVVATDRRGQASATPVRLLRHDATAPKLAFRVSGARKAGKPVRVSVTASDASGSVAKASGIAFVRISFGDGGRVLVARDAIRRLRKGSYDVRVSATDKAGNAIAETRRIRIR